MDNEKTRSDLEDVVLIGECIIADATRDLKLLMTEIETDQDPTTLSFLTRLRDINSTLDNYYIAV